MAKNLKEFLAGSASVIAARKKLLTARAKVQNELKALSGVKKGDSLYAIVLKRYETAKEEAATAQKEADANLAKATDYYNKNEKEIIAADLLARGKIDAANIKAATASRDAMAGLGLDTTVIDKKIAAAKKALENPAVVLGSDTGDKTKTVEKKPDDFAGLIKTATEYIKGLSGAERKLLAKSLNDSMGSKLVVSEATNPQDLLVAYTGAIGQAQNRYNVFKDVYTLGEFLAIKKIETAAEKAAGVKDKKPPITDYPVISSDTDITKLINSVFQTNLDRDATADEIKFLRQPLKDAQLKNPTYYKKTTINGKVTQIQYSGLDSGQWILNQITTNEKLNLKSELDKAKTVAPDLTKRLADKKIYDDLITKAKGDPAKIAIINETSTYGRGLKEISALVQATADANSATNTPEELAKLAKTLFDKGIAANSFEAQAELDKVLKIGSSLVKNKAQDVIQRLADKRIYDNLIKEAGTDQAKITEANETTAYGRGLKEMLIDIETQASDKGAINTPEELKTLAESLYSRGILIGSSEGLKAINALFKNDKGLIKGQPADLVTLAANKKIYDVAITEAAGDPAKIEAANKNTVYGRGLKEILSIIQATAEANGATNTPEELSALATEIFDQGISIESAEASAKIDKTLKSSSGLVKNKAASLRILAANKKIYDDLIAQAGNDPAKIAAANETTEYGLGLRSIITALQTKAKKSNATNTVAELTAIATNLYDKGLTLDSPEGIAAIDAALSTDGVLVSEIPVDLKKLAADKKIYDARIVLAKGDPAKIAAARDTTEYGRGLKEIIGALQAQAKDGGATNTLAELEALATKLYDKGVSLNSDEGIAAIGVVLKNKNGLIKDQAPDLTKRLADKKIYDDLIAGAGEDPTLIAQAKKTTAYGRGLAGVEAALKSKLSKSGATNTLEEITAIAQDLFDNGINPASDEGLAKINKSLKYTPNAKTGKYSGTAGTTIADLQATAVANGLDLQKNFGNQISGWLTAIDNGEQIDNIKQKIRDVAKLGQPEYIKKLIDNGGDLESIYAPYKNTMASVLEIQDPNSIKLEDPTLRMAISPTGELNLYDYKKALRKDNRWQYTQQARSEVAYATKQVLQDFGFMG